MEKKLPFKKAKPAAEPKAEETAPEAVDAAADAAAPGSAEPAPAQATTKKAGKAVKPAKGGSKGLAAKSREKSAAKQATTKKKRVSSVRPVRGGIQFICSECYEEFRLPATYSRDTVTCPECMHVGKRPNEDFLREVNAHKSGEKGTFVGALFFGELMLVAALVFMWLNTQYSQGMDATRRPMFAMIVGGAAAFLAIVLLVITWKYENNRWEIYF